MISNRARGDKRIIFTGFVFGQDYRALQQSAYCYVHATEVGARIRPCSRPWVSETVLTLAAPENIEAVGDAGILYHDEKDLAHKLQPRAARRLAGPRLSQPRSGPGARTLHLGPGGGSVRTTLFADMAGISLPHDRAPVAVLNRVAAQAAGAVMSAE